MADYFCATNVMKWLNSFKIQNVIAVIVILGGYIIISFVEVSESESQQINNLMLIVVGYLFGSSKSSNVKDETISDLSKK